jgi:nucleotide-binding universal stress UspA family protein
MNATSGAPPYPTRILCATDFTPFSRHALEYAIALARPAAAEITILHVLPFPLPSIDSDDEPDWMPPGPGGRTEALEQLRRFAEPAEAAGLRARTLLRMGVPSDEILRAVTELEPDLVVMGSHARRGLERLIGSHAVRVLRLAPCPVLTVSLHEGAAPADTPVRIQEVLCAASGSERSPRTVEYAQCLAEGAQAHMTLLCVANPARPSSDILDEAKKRAADLIVIGNHDRGLGIVGYLGSTSARVVRDADCAVLTVKSGPWPSERAEADRSASERTCLSIS